MSGRIIYHSEEDFEAKARASYTSAPFRILGSCNFVDIPHVLGPETSSNIISRDSCRSLRHRSKPAGVFLEKLIGRPRAYARPAMKPSYEGACRARYSGRSP